MRNRVSRNDFDNGYGRHERIVRSMPGLTFFLKKPLLDIATLPPKVSPIDGYCNECQSHHLINSFDGPFTHAKNCTRTAKMEVLPVMLIGNAGTSFGSRIKGHARRGGKKMRKEHQKNCVVGITDEYRTSKVCIYCFQEVRVARSRRMVKGKSKMVRVHGALECINPACPSFKEGYTIKARDPHAATAIAIAGGCALLSTSHKTLPPFSRVPIESTDKNTSPSNWNHQNRSLDQPRSEEGSSVKKPGL
jgi:hypothetical protein